VKLYEVAGPCVDDENEFMVLLIEDDEPSEEICCGSRDFCEREMVRLNVKALLSAKTVTIKVLPFLLHPPIAS
jgi:hypothetical protein